MKNQVFLLPCHLISIHSADRYRQKNRYNFCLHQWNILRTGIVYNVSVNSMQDILCRLQKLSIKHFGVIACLQLRHYRDSF